MSDDLLYRFIGSPNQQGTVGTALGVEGPTRHGRPAALFPDVGDGTGVARIEIIGRLPSGGRDVAE